MKLMSLVLLGLFASFAFGTDNCGYTPIGSSSHIEFQDTDAVSLTVVNSFETGRNALGLDLFSAPAVNQIIAVCRDSLKIFTYELDGSVAASISLDPANTNCFGFAWNDNIDSRVYNTNNWSSTDLYTSENLGDSWTTSANPAEHQGRGMDFDGTDFWQTGADQTVWRFQPGGAAEEITVPGISGSLSGLTTFPYGGNMGIVVAVYGTYNLYFYEWDGSSLSSLGSAACPGTDIDLSLGLTYNPVTGNMHWSYLNTSGDYIIVEYTFDISAALERSSWGSIKSSF